MLTPIFWVIFFSLMGVAEVILGVYMFKNEHIASGIFMVVLGVTSFVLSGVIGVLG